MATREEGDQITPEKNWRKKCGQHVSDTAGETWRRRQIEVM